MEKENIARTENSFDARFSMPSCLQERIGEVYQQYNDGLLSKYEYANAVHIVTLEFIENLDLEIDSYRRQLRG